VHLLLASLLAGAQLALAVLYRQAPRALPADALPSPASLG
jgi:hypothetical protein